MRNITLLLSFLLLSFAALLLGADSSPVSAADAPKPDADGWYSLFNGKDFDGWKKSEDNPDTFQIVDGEIVVKGPRAHLFYVGPVNKANFKNFEWKCEILTKLHANSGMYFHTKYEPNTWPKHGIEVQVNNTHGDPVKTGSLYKFKNVMNNSPAKDNEWFTQHVIVDGQHITIKVNDMVVNEFEWPEGFKRDGGFETNLLSEGTFALQGHDPDSEIHYRKVLVKPLP